MSVVGRIRANPLAAASLAVALVGVGLLAFPSASAWWAGVRQGQSISAYEQVVAQMDARERAVMLEAAERHNAELAQEGVAWQMSDEQVAAYNALLDVDGAGMMGYVEIPKVDVRLPLFHGTDEAVLEQNVGHLAGTSLPVGGEGTHCVVSAHRSLPSARLFADLGMLEVGDHFSLLVLDRVCAYEVDQVRIVEPADLSDLVIDRAQDYATLVTCTPYGVNSHRLLVRGHRVDAALAADAPALEGRRADPLRPENLAAVPLIAAAGLLAVFARTRRKGEGIHEHTPR